MTAFVTQLPSLLATTMPRAIRHPHVQRVDNDATRTYCWIVRIQCKGHIATRYFSDHPHGGKRLVLQAAIAWRDAVLEQIQHERHQWWLQNCTRIRRNNTSGTVGVGRHIAHDNIKGEEVERAFWQAFWQGVDGKRYSRKFMVGKHGEKRAKALACTARKQALAEQIVLRTPPLSTQSS